MAVVIPASSPPSLYDHLLLVLYRIGLHIPSTQAATSSTTLQARVPSSGKQVVFAPN